MFPIYPYLNVNDLNLDYILKAIGAMQNELKNFIVTNSIKYADPIQWNITNQYEKNTVVIDPLTGTAYISVAPVPIGVSLSNTDYWTVVFDLGSFVVRAAKNFSDHYEPDTTLTATFSSAAGDWLVWGDELYVALVNITAGDQYVVGSNILHVTMEDVCGHLDSLNTSDKTNLVNAINSVLVTMTNVTGDLANLTTTDKSNLVNAINEVITTFNTIIGNLNNLTTTDKSSVVNAINSLKSSLPFINVADYGILPGNNVYDELYDLLYNVVNPQGGAILYFPKGKYTIDYTIIIPENTIFVGEGAETEIYFDESDTWYGVGLVNGGSNVAILNMTVSQLSTGAYDVRGSLPGCMAFGDTDFNGLSGTKRAHEQPTKAGNKNIVVRNVNCSNSNYGFQIQPKTYAVGNIFVENFTVANGMFSIAPNEIATPDSIYNVYCDNITCDSFRFYGGDNPYKCDKIFVNGLNCTQIAMTGAGTVHIANFTLNAGDGNRLLSSFKHDCAILSYGAHQFVNGRITKSITTNPFTIIQSLANSGLGKVIQTFTNVIVEDVSAFGSNAIDTHTQGFAFVNCNFRFYDATREVITNYTEVDASAYPTIVHYNMSPERSEIKACLVFPGGINAETEIARLNDQMYSYVGINDNSPVYGHATLFKSTDPAAGCEPCGIKIDTFHIYAERIITANSPSDWDAIEFEINW